MEYELERRLETVETTYVKIGGEEFKAGLVLDFLQQLQGTGFAKRLRWERKFEDLADALIEKGVVQRDVRGSWMEVERGIAKEVHDDLTDRYLALEEKDDPVTSGAKGRGYCFDCHTEFDVEKLSAGCPSCGSKNWWSEPLLIGEEGTDGD